ncbi:hypothetical protein [Ramlibacter tataouinensis]|uniref:Uncharacterized protein n=1 Tax=Ramlibacter tataouinensis (strain ATCC BAA-407 / DSM 14655 / LMG 21543 / TTB310) TaxID=365046 RepID=F5Y081_RAMTT|nr:hypothetical protein [Ramlibacter tataouinensis]AEG92103.1 hypothetical protein Rta_10190 [Ramlibacter tataouinensis TTB310]
MSDLSSLALWLLSGVALAAVISALITRHLRLREARREQGLRLLHALARYSAWVASQRRNAAFVLHDDVAETALQEAARAQALGFPRLSRQWSALMDVHTRLAAFLAAQQRLRLADPEAWLESDHDGRFMQLWREHEAALHALTDRLELATGASFAGPEPGSA